VKYLYKSFSSRPSSDAYRKGWEATFRKREPEPALSDLVLAEAALLGVSPDRVAPSVDGGVIFYFFSPGYRRASLECYDTGELVLLRSSSSADVPIVEEIQSSRPAIRDALVKIVRFITPVLRTAHRKEQP
jgi:hypothetical protein